MTPDNHNSLLPLFSPMAQAPAKKYRTLVADPPWRIETMGFTKMGMKPALVYPTMTQDELLNLPVGAWAEDKAHLYLWTTNSKIGDALELAKAWGFKFNTLLTWIKRNPPKNEDVDSPWDDHSLGLGRNHLELLVMAPKEIPITRRNAVRQEPRSKDAVAAN